MASLGSLVVSLSANTAQFTSDLGKAAHISEQRMKDIREAAETAGKAIGAAFVAGVGVAAVLVKQAIDAADAMDDLAQKSGASMESLSGLAYVANMEGKSIETLTASLSRLTQSTEDAASGQGEAARYFSALGISATDANGKLKNSDAVMVELADKFAAMEDGAGKTALAMGIFGKSGADMIPILNAGSEGLARATEEARAFGLMLDGETSAAAANFNDNLTRLNAAKQGFANQIMQAMLPSLSALTDQLVEGAKQGNGFARAAEVAASGMKILATIGAIVAGTFKTVGEYLGGLAAQVVAIVSGRFSEALDIANQANEDVASNIAGISKTISNIWAEAEAKSESQAEKTSDKLAAPIVRTAQKVKESRDKIVKDTTSINDSWVKMIDQQIEEEKRKADEIGKFAEESKDTQKTELSAMTEYAQEAARNMQDAMAGGFFDLFEGKTKSMGDLFATMVKRMAAELMSSQLLNLLVGDFAKTGSMGGVVGSIAANIFGGGKALGGDVKGGTSYLVGEKGPELFTPAMSGSITPNNAMGGSITFAPVYQIDSRADRQQVQQDMQRISRQANAELVEKLQRQGRLA